MDRRLFTWWFQTHHQRFFRGTTLCTRLEGTDKSSHGFVNYELRFECYENSHNCFLQHRQGQPSKRTSTKRPLSIHNRVCKHENDHPFFILLKTFQNPDPLQIIVSRPKFQSLMLILQSRKSTPDVAHKLKTRNANMAKEPTSAKENRSDLRMLLQTRWSCLVDWVVSICCSSCLGLKVP